MKNCQTNEKKNQPQLLHQYLSRGGCRKVSCCQVWKEKISYKPRFHYKQRFNEGGGSTYLFIFNVWKFFWFLKILVYNYNLIYPLIYSGLEMQIFWKKCVFLGCYKINRLEIFPRSILISLFLSHGCCHTCFMTLFYSTFSC